MTVAVTWATFDDQREETGGFLAATWKAIRGLGVAIVFMLAVAGPLCANVSQMFSSTAWWWVFPALLSAILMPVLFGIAWSRNNEAGERIAAAMLYFFCMGWDWYNSASNHAANSDSQRQIAVDSNTTQSNIAGERERLTKLYDGLAAKESDSVGTLEAKLAAKRIENATLWDVSMGCTKVHAPRRGHADWYAEKGFCADYMKLQGRLENARDRDKAKADRALLGNDAHKERSRAGSQINNTEEILAWFGFKAGEDRTAWANTIASLISWGNSLFMTVLGSMAPHFAFIYFFKTLDPSIAERKRLERVRAREAKKAAKDAARAARAEVRRNDKEAKEAVKREKREAKLEAERLSRERNEVTPEATESPPAEAKPEPQTRAFPPDPNLDAYCSRWLQEVDDQSIRVKTSDLFKSSWCDFCDHAGLPTGKSTALTKRLQQRFKWEKSGGSVWLLGVALKGKSERPRFKIVS